MSKLNDSEIEGIEELDTQCLQLSVFIDIYNS